MAMRQHDGEQHDDSQRNTFYRIQDIQFQTNSLFYIKRACCWALSYSEVLSICVSKQNNAKPLFPEVLFWGALWMGKFSFNVLMILNHTLFECDANLQPAMLLRRHNRSIKLNQRTARMMEWPQRPAETRYQLPYTMGPWYQVPGPVGPRYQVD